MSLPRRILSQRRAARAALALGLASAPAAAGPLSPDVEEGERLFVADDLKASSAALDRALAANPNDVEALWRKARNLYQQGEIAANSGASAASRIQSYEQVQALAKRAQAADPAHPQGYFWEGTALGRIATAKGVLSSLFMADDIEGLWKKAEKMTGYSYRATTGTSAFPADVYFALGQFYRLCPDWTVVKMLTGTKGDIEQSIRYLRKGVADSPDRLEMHKELGVSLLCKAERTGDAAAKAEGEKVLRHAQGIPPRKGTDPIDLKQIPIILSRADEACGYSRDGWQDVSEESYQKR